jgi:acyl-CoA thioesterase YciA
MATLEDTSTPKGELTLKIIASANDANTMGDIYAGWIVSQMDLGGSIYAERRAQGRVATVSMGAMSFLSPVKVGSTVSFYTDFLNIGRSSLEVRIDVWVSDIGSYEQRKVSDGILTFVAIDKGGRTRALPQR